MKISVIIPSYKPGEYIKECLSSLKRQTLSADDFEIVVVLNGCDAPYQSVLEKYIQEENIVNAHVIHTDTPGVSNARNVGCSILCRRIITNECYKRKQTEIRQLNDSRLREWFL